MSMHAKYSDPPFHGRLSSRIATLLDPRGKASVSVVLFAWVTFCVLPAHADTKVISARASYTMGDGETASFAEAMVLQKAKQFALEEAGTYVEAYTKAVNQDLTVEEINTIAGGVISTEVVSLTRTLVGDGLRFDIQIKAVVTTGKVEELIRRVRGTSLAKEHEQLQAKYAQLTGEIDALKRSVSAISKAPKRDSDSQLEDLRDKIREVEREFRKTQTSENKLYRRLLSGAELASELQKQLQAERARLERETHRRIDAERALDHAIGTLQNDGHEVEFGKPQVTSKGLNAGLVFPVRVTASAEGMAALRELSMTDDGDDAICQRLDDTLAQLALIVVVSLKDGSQYSAIAPGIHSYQKHFCWYDWNSVKQVTPRETTVEVDVPADRIGDVVSVEGHIGMPQGEARSAITSLADCDFKQNSAKPIATGLQVQAGAGNQAFLNRIQQRIMSFWSASKIDAAASCNVVVVKFRLHRNGTVSGMAIERSSGNEYYDLAAKRAIVSASPLPGFPENIHEAYWDARFTFQSGR